MPKLQSTSSMSRRKVEPLRYLESRWCASSGTANRAFDADDPGAREGGPPWLRALAPMGCLAGRVSETSPRAKMRPIIRRRPVIRSSAGRNRLDREPPTISPFFIAPHQGAREKVGMTRAGVVCRTFRRVSRNQRLGRAPMRGRRLSSRVEDLPPDTSKRLQRHGFVICVGRVEDGQASKQ